MNNDGAGTLRRLTSLAFGLAFVVFALALASLADVAQATVIEAKWKGTVVASSDAPNILGYGGGDSAIGSRITIKFRWNTADAPDALVGANPAEADYGSGLPMWLVATVEFDNGFEMTSREFANSEGVSQPIKIQDDYYSPCATGVSGCDSYGNALQTSTAYLQLLDTFYAYSRITDYTLGLVSGLERDQLLSWSPGAAGTFFADGQFSYRRADRQNPANDFDVWAFAHMDFLDIRAISEPGSLALLGLGLAALAFTRRRNPAGNCIEGREQ